LIFSICVRRQILYIGISERRGDDRRDGRRDAVGGEDAVVRSRLAGKPFDELAANGDGKLPAGYLGAAEREAVIPVNGREMHELVGHLVVILQRVHEPDRL